MTAEDDRHMAHALAIGRRGMGRTWPNPAVGCVIVAGGHVVGRGWTADGGRPHAETVALAQAGTAARGATAYVTLEPCAHHGETPPCAKALIEAEVARVVTAIGDPDPRVDGGGHAMLACAGIALTSGIRAAEAADDHAGFLLRMTKGRPLVTLKLATSFDGRIATRAGESRWITGPAARRWVHAERARHDAILIGGGTARADDPALTVRGLGNVHQPVRVVAARLLDVPRGGALARTEAAGPLWLLHGAIPREVRAAWDGIARLIEVETGGSDRLPPDALVHALAGAGLTRVFCEGGGTFGAALLRAGVVDRIIGMTAGVALGADARPALGDLGIDALADAPRFDLTQTEPVEGDVVHIWRRRNGM